MILCNVLFNSADVPFLTLRSFNNASKKRYKDNRLSAPRLSLLTINKEKVFSLNNMSVFQELYCEALYPVGLKRRNGRIFFK